ATAAADQPPDSHEIEDSDPQPIPQAGVGRAGMTRPIHHVDKADIVALAPDQRPEQPERAVRKGQRQKAIPPTRLAPAASKGRGGGATGGGPGDWRWAIAAS